jgi:site-specific recombinase XerD
MNNRTISLSMLKQYEMYLCNDEKSKSTVEKYLRDLNRFLEFVSGADINKSIVLEYKGYLKEHYATASANSMIASLNSFFKYADWNDCCVKQFKVQKKAFASEDKELTREEYVRLVETARRRGNERLCLILQTICGTGIRISELKHITVEAVKQGQATVACKGKTRVIFIVAKLKKQLLRYAQMNRISTGAIFVTSSGKDISRCNIWRDMKSLCRYAGVSPNKVFPHNLRHLFARIFYNLEKDIVKLADILGHSSINTTRIYIITTGFEHRRKMENMRLIL